MPTFSMPQSKIQSRPDLRNCLYFETTTNRHYLLLDGALRLIPTAKAFTSLFRDELEADDDHCFTTARHAPVPIGLPLLDNAKLVTIFDGRPPRIFLTDYMSWDPERIVLRHVTTTSQLHCLGFDPRKVVLYKADPIIGVPLAIDSPSNVKLVQTLAGYYSIYGHLIMGAPINPQFEGLVANYPHEPKSSYKNVIKMQILAAQAALREISWLGK